MTGAPSLVGSIAGSRVLALSPHADDLALSVGGLLRQLARMADVTVVSVFTRSAWAPAVTAARRTPGAVSALRVTEDRTYCRALSVSYASLGLPDAGLRGYDARGELGTRRRDDTAGVVSDALAGLVTAVGPDAVLCPLGLGGHVDHVLVAGAARSHVGGNRLWLLYEDLPYAARMSDRALAASVARVAPRARPWLVEISATLPAKLVDLQYYYPSQRLHLYGPILRRHARRVNGGRGYAERFWASGSAETFRCG